MELNSLNPALPTQLPGGTFLFCRTFPFSTRTGDGGGFRALFADTVRFNSGVRNGPCWGNGAEGGRCLPSPALHALHSPPGVPPTSEPAELAVAAMWPFKDLPMASRFISEPAFSLPCTRQALSGCPTFSSSLGKALFPARTVRHGQAQAPLNPAGCSSRGWAPPSAGAELLRGPTDEDIQPVPSFFLLRQRQGALGPGETPALELGAQLCPLRTGSPVPESCC